MSAYCPAGHLLTPARTHVTARETRCRVCDAQRTAERSRRKLEARYNGGATTPATDSTALPPPVPAPEPLPRPDGHQGPRKPTSREALAQERDLQLVSRIPPWLAGDRVLLGPLAQPDLRGKVVRVRSLVGNRQGRAWVFWIVLEDGRSVRERWVERLVDDGRAGEKKL